MFYAHVAGEKDPWYDDKSQSTLWEEKKPDPLLRHPKIDFQNHMVLVIVSHEPNGLIDLEIVGVQLAGKAMQVLCRYGEPGPIVQKVISHGAYSAVLVNRFDGDVVFIRNSD